MADSLHIAQADLLRKAEAAADLHTARDVRVLIQALTEQQVTSTWAPLTGLDRYRELLHDPTRRRPQCSFLYAHIEFTEPSPATEALCDQISHVSSQRTRADSVRSETSRPRAAPLPCASRGGRGAADGHAVPKASAKLVISGRPAPHGR